MMEAGLLFHNRYRLSERLGLGGFSEVWKATDEQSDIVYAIKIFLKQNIEGIKLCREEFIKTHNLEHKNILRPSHFDVCDGQPYMIMPFIAGGTLQSRLGHIDDLDCRNIVEQIGGALNYIHHRDNPIIHGDVKPDNILISDNGEFLLTDFGISQKLKQVYTQTLGAVQSTQDNQVGATPIAYRAPELIRYKDWQTVGPSTKSDIWSFGMMLYYLKNKELAFNGEGGLGQLMLMKGGGLTLTEALDYTRENDQFDIRKLIHQCLALTPDQRPDIVQLDELNQAPREIENSHKTSKNKGNKAVVVKAKNSEEQNKSRLFFTMVTGIIVSSVVFYFIYANRKPQVIHTDTLVIPDTATLMNAQLLTSDTSNNYAIKSSSKNEDLAKSNAIQKLSKTTNKVSNSNIFSSATIKAETDLHQQSLPVSTPENNVNTSVSTHHSTESSGKEQTKFDSKPIIESRQITNKDDNSQDKEATEAEPIASGKSKVTYNQIVSLKVTSAITNSSGLKKNDVIALEVVEDVKSQNAIIIAKGSSASAIVKNIDEKKLEIEIPKLFSSGGTPIKTLLPKVFFKANENGLFAAKGTKLEVKTNEFKDVLIK